MEGNFLLAKAEHSDFLGAFSGIGLKSEDMGDIVIERDKGCLTFTSPEIFPILQKKLTNVLICKTQNWDLGLGTFCSSESDKNSVRRNEVTSFESERDKYSGGINAIGYSGICSFWHIT